MCSRPVLYATALVALVVSGCAEPIADDPGPDVWRGEDTDHEGAGDTDAEGVAALSDLRVTLAPVGADTDRPYGDGSGRVTFGAVATGAVRYVVFLDGRPPIERPDGQGVFTVDHEGLDVLTVEVLAFDADGASASATEEVTVLRTIGPFSTLVWADEFEDEGAVDPAKWKPQTLPPVDGGWFNGEHQHYTDRLDNAYVSDGTLKIVARKEAFTIEGSTKQYTSARLNSRFFFTYGRVEVRARLPSQGGTWPAIWTLGTNINERGNPFGDTYGDVGWPACGEIDILEQTGWDKGSTIAHFHWGDTETGAYHNEGGSIANPDATTAFHVYALEWTEDDLSVFVDDQLVHRMPNDRGRPYDNDHYLLLNIAMGGNLGGDIPRAFDEAVMEIDYVRVYQ